MSDPASLVGAVLADRYRVVASLGASSVGAVYEAEDTTTGAHVALKLLLPEAGKEPKAAARFVREAKTLGLLAHPSIVRLLDHGQLSDGTFYLVVELVRGSSLREVMDEGPVEPRRALAIVRQVVEALGHAHDHGVVHRDISPENIMLAEGGAPEPGRELVKVLDFGVAKLVEDTLAVLGEAKLTQTAGNVIGAPRYASPEAALGRPVDRRADLYAAGLVLFELVTGRPPFSEPDPTAVLRQHASARAPALAEVAPDRAFSPQLEHVVAEALVKDPGRRFASASEMIGALDAALSVLDPPPEIAPRTGQTVLGLGPGPGTSAPGAAGGGGPAAPAAADPGTAVPPPVVGSPSSDEAPSSLPPPPALVLNKLPGRLDPRRRRQIIGIGVAVIAIVIAIVATRGTPAPGSTTRSFTAASGAPASGAPASELDRRAMDLIARGDAAGASDLLEHALATASARNDPRAYLALGHARIALGRRAEGLAAYERAIVLDPELAGDAQMKQSVIRVLDTRDVAAGIVALELLVSRIHPPAREQILAQASNGKVLEVRHRAIAIAEREGFAEGIDQVESWSLDLEQATTCEDRRAAVVKLGAAGDRRALITLRRMRGKFACNDRDVASAIATLEARP